MNTGSVRITALAAELGVSVYDVVTACSRSGIVGDGLRVSPEEAELLRSVVHTAPPVDTPTPEAALPPSNVEIPGTLTTARRATTTVDLRALEQGEPGAARDGRPAIVVVPGPNVPYPQHRRRRLGRIIER